jgi:putative membrane protein
MLTGLVIFSRVLSWVLHHYYRQTTLVITGILIASLWLIWPFQDRVYETLGENRKLVSSTPVLPDRYDAAFILTVILVLSGIAAVLMINRLAGKGYRQD